MSHLKNYPTPDSLRLLVPAEVIASKVAGLSDHYRTDEIARYTGKISADALRAWADLYEGIQQVYPNAQMNKDLVISYALPYEELEEIALRSEASDRYYHPENYPEYTDEDIAD